MAESVGFEPTRVSPTAFPEQRHRPLGELSTKSILIHNGIAFQIYKGRNLSYNFIL